MRAGAKMYNPLVSIIIPVYNGSNYLRESIDSALAQKYKNVEIIVVNDGSNDDGVTEQIALSYGNKISYYYKENGGVATALNLGIEKMNGEWFSWLSHDDLYMPTKIESQINKIIEEKLDVKKTIISCKSILVDVNGEKIYRPKKFDTGLFTGEEMFKRLFNDKILSGCSLLIPKTEMREVGGFNKEYRFIQDLVCWVELSLRKNNFYIYEEELIKSRIHPDQDSNKIANIHPIEMGNFAKNILEELSYNIKEDSYYTKTILFFCCTTMDNKETRKIYISKLKENSQFNISDRIKYVVFLTRGTIIRLIKKIYRFLFNIKYRGTK